MNSARLTDPHRAIDYILAGNATFTLRSLASGTRYTYKVSQSQPDPQGQFVHFVGLLSGPDNESDYRYMGIIRHNEFTVTRKSQFSPETLPVKAFYWAFGQLLDNRMPNSLEFWHEGACGRCGRKLTVPESIATGFGPECA